MYYLLFHFFLITIIPSTIATGGYFQLRLNLPPCPQCTQTSICLKNYQVNIDPSNCYIGSSTLSHNSNGSLDTTAQLQYEFKFRWPGTFSLLVQQWSSDEIIRSYGIQRWLDISSKWSGNGTISYRVICLKNYYGVDCGRYCRGRDDRFGHYECDEGGRRCLDGWGGDYCERAVCSPPCSPTHGSCTAPSTCTCHAGWTGPTCSSCIMYPGCKNGRCTKQWECECFEGWGGLFCNQDLNYCTNHRPCRNGGTCFNTGQGSYTCECTEGWGGVDCETATTAAVIGGECDGDDRREGNGTCAPPPLEKQKVDDDGRRNSGMKEEKQAAEINLCVTAPCANGGSCTPTRLSYTCVCPRPFHGPDCSCPCLNGGSCSVGSSACICPVEWTGPRCGQLSDNYTLDLLQQFISSEEELSNEHVLFIIMSSISIPFLVLFSVCVILVLRRRRLLELERNARLALEQNEINTANNINKLKDIYIGNNIYSKMTNYERNLDVVGTAETIATEHALNEGVEQQREQRQLRDKCVNYSFQPDTLLSSMLDNYPPGGNSSDLSKLATQV